MNKLDQEEDKKLKNLLDEKADFNFITEKEYSDKIWGKSKHSFISKEKNFLKKKFNFF